MLLSELRNALLPLISPPLTVQVQPEDLNEAAFDAYTLQKSIKTGWQNLSKTGLVQKLNYLIWLDSASLWLKSENCCLFHRAGCITWSKQQIVWLCGQSEAFRSKGAAITLITSIYLKGFPQNCCPHCHLAQLNTCPLKPTVIDSRS